MKKLILLTCLLLAGLSSAPNAHATLLSADDLKFGPGSFTIDTATGLGWLDLSQTFDKSMNSIKAEFGSGGTYAGLRYATADEVRTLYSDGGAHTSASAEGFYSVYSMLTMMGFSQLYQSPPIKEDGIPTEIEISVNGITGTGPIDEWDHYIGSSIIANRFSGWDIGWVQIDWIVDDLTFTSTSHNLFTGSYLVREATEPIPTPEPSTFLLLGIGLVGAAVMKMKKMWV